MSIASFRLTTTTYLCRIARNSRPRLLYSRGISLAARKRSAARMPANARRRHVSLATRANERLRKSRLRRRLRRQRQVSCTWRLSRNRDGDTPAVAAIRPRTERPSRKKAASVQRCRADIPLHFGPPSRRIPAARLFFNSDGQKRKISRRVPKHKSRKSSFCNITI